MIKHLAIVAALTMASPALAGPCPAAFDPKLNETTKSLEIAWLRGFDMGAVTERHVLKCRDGDAICVHDRETDYFALVKGLCRRHPTGSLGEAAGGAEGVLAHTDKFPSNGPMTLKACLMEGSK